LGIIAAIIKYLIGTRERKLTLGGTVTEFIIHRFLGRRLGGELEKRRSRTGFAIFVGPALIIYGSRLQTSVALSTIKAEYNVLTETAFLVIWLRSLMEEVELLQ
jgi:hypothetical protein